MEEERRIGVADGAAVGVAVGAPVGATDGTAVGTPVGDAEGAMVGAAVVADVGVGVGASVGAAVGAPVGDAEGAAVGVARACVVGSLVLVMAGVAHREARRGPRDVRVEIELARWPRELDGYRIVQISDIHIGPTLDRRFAQEITERVNALAADLVAVTGDLVDGSRAALEEEVAPLKTDLVMTVAAAGHPLCAAHRGRNVATGQYR